MKKPDYSYQELLIKDVMNHFANGAEIVVLAAAPSAGKTKMALEIHRRLNSRTLVLTHGTYLIRQHWAERAKNFNPAVLEVGFKQSELNKNLVLSLPQTLVKKTKNKKFDLLIVDEGHERYDGIEINEIIKNVKPKRQLILTGSPQNFLKNPKYEVVGISAQELLDKNVISDPLIKILESPYRLPFSDYNKNLYVKEAKTFSSEDTQKTLHTSLNYLEKNGCLPLEKTMVVCHNQRQAVDVFNYLEHLGYKTTLSISDVSNGVEELKQFVEGDSKIFVVVHRGILGFDFPDLMNVIDISCTLNPFRLFQLLCRLIRPNNNNKKKIFLKITDKEMAPITYVMMNFCVALSHPKYYFSLFSSRRTLIPIPAEINAFTFDLSQAKIFKISELKDLKLLATTTFYKVRRKIQAKEDTNFFDILELAKLCKTRIEFRKEYPHFYRRLEKNGLLHLLDPILPKREEVHWRSRPLDENIKIINQLIEEKGYRTLYKFRMENSGAYKYLQKMKAFDRINLSPYFTKWTLDSALNCAKKFKHVSHFYKKHPGAYEFLQRIDALPSFKTSKYAKRWDEKSVLEVSKKCKNLRDLRTKYYGAYKFLRRNPKVKIPHFRRNTVIGEGFKIT